MSDEPERPGLFGRKDDVRLRASYLLKTELRKARSVEEGSGAGVGMEEEKNDTSPWEKQPAERSEVAGVKPRLGGLSGWK